MNTRFTRRAAAFVLALLITSGLVAPVGSLAQSRRTPPQAPQKKNPRPDEQQPTTDPQLKQEPQEPIPADVLKEQEIVKVASNIVQVEAVVYHKKTGQIVMGLKKENFAIFEDNIQREVTNFSTPDAPITVAVVLEYSKLGQRLGYAGAGGMEPGQYEVLRPMAAFLEQIHQAAGRLRLGHRLRHAADAADRLHQRPRPHRPGHQPASAQPAGLPRGEPLRRAQARRSSAAAPTRSCWRTPRRRRRSTPG